MPDETTLAPLFEDGTYPCAAARRIIGKVLAGSGTMHYTRAAIGKGSLTEGEEPRLLMEPPDYVMDGKISAVTSPIDGECQVTVQVNSADVECDTFYATGILLYALDPETQDEVPYAYLSMEEAPEMIRSQRRAVGKLAIFDMITAVGEVKNVTATIDPNALMTRAEVEQLIADSNPRMEIQLPVTGWKSTDDADADIRPGLGMLVGVEDDPKFYISVPVTLASEDTFPDLLFADNNSTIAAEIGVDECIAVDSAVIITAHKKPTENMRATLVLRRTTLVPAV